MTQPTVSFEFFPPADDAAVQRLQRVMRRLVRLGPAFFSVTYGADGSTRSRTEGLVCWIRQDLPVPPAAHLTCVGSTRAQTDALALRWWALGIRHIVALRGDPPKGADRYRPEPGGYGHAADLVRGIRAAAAFEISVAGYPEPHPESPSPAADIDNLKAKVDAGADRVLTQYFFDNACFLRFRDRCRAAGITAPIVPGILPVTDFRRVAEFSRRCGVTIPPRITAIFEPLDADARTREMIAAGAAVSQCEDLRREGVNAFHFYTLNRARLSYAICWWLGLRGAADPGTARAAAEPGT